MGEAIAGVVDWHWRSSGSFAFCRGHQLVNECCLWTVLHISHCCASYLKEGWKDFERGDGDFWVGKWGYPWVIINWAIDVSELALVTHQPRAASAYAMGPVKCAGKRSEVELNIAARDTDCCFLFGLWVPKSLYFAILQYPGHFCQEQRACFWSAVYRLLMKVI